jgi:hypothetical protein
MPASRTKFPWALQIHAAVPLMHMAPRVPNDLGTRRPQFTGPYLQDQGGN